VRLTEITDKFKLNNRKTVNAPVFQITPENSVNARPKKISVNELK